MHISSNAYKKLFHTSCPPNNHNINNIGEDIIYKHAHNISAKTKGNAFIIISCFSNIINKFFSNIKIEIILIYDNNLISYNNIAIITAIINIIKDIMKDIINNQKYLNMTKNVEEC